VKNKNINYGKKELLADEDFEPKNIKVRINTYIDLDVIDALKKEAKRNGEKYQTLLNQKLREIVLDDKITTIKDIERRLKKVENLLKVVNH